MAVYSSYSDNELTELLKSGDQVAFAELYRKFSQRIYTNLLKLLKDDQLAQELLQETFIKIWEKRAQLTYEVSFRSYLYRVSENLVRDFFRRASRDKKLLDHLIAIAAPYEITDELPEREPPTQELFTKAIEQLSPKRRQIFTLCKVEGRSYEEISLMLGISTSTINDHIVKATKSIRTYIKTPGNAAILLLTATLVGQFEHLPH